MPVSTENTENTESLVHSALKGVLQENSDDILRALMNQKADRLRMLSENPSGESLTEAEEAYETIAICRDILQERKQERESAARALRQKNQQESSLAWKKQVPVRQIFAVRRLPYAVSFHGQLIAAVLEEEGAKTSEELKNWCEELQSMGEEEFRECLEGLTAEKIIRSASDSSDNRKYELISVLNDQLFPADGQRFVRIAMEEAGEEITDQEAPVVYMILNRMDTEKKGLDAGQIFDGQNSRLEVLSDYLADGGQGAETEISEDRIRICLEKMEKAGALSAALYNGVKKYYYPMLGEQ